MVGNCWVFVVGGGGGFAREAGQEAKLLPYEHGRGGGAASAVHYRSNEAWTDLRS